MNRLTYTALFYLAMPLVFLRLLWRARKSPEYLSRWRERLGLYGDRPRLAGEGPSIVFHAVSVGEVHAVVPLIQLLLAGEARYRVVMTTSTPTGSTRVHELFGDRVEHFYLPYDLPGAVRRFLHFVRPDALVMMETELWPNLIHYSHALGARLLLANARLSEKSRRGYDRFRPLIGAMLAAVDRVAAQSEADGRRLLALGLPPEKLRVTGSMKYDLEPSAALVEAGRSLRRHLGGQRPVLIAASTREGEDAKVLQAFAAVLGQEPDALLILVPRHPERFSAARELCRERGLRVGLRSEYPGGRDWRGMQVLLGDSMGEMMMYYAAADIAFVGGSLVDTGCQNILEPAALGMPVLTGPSLYNFKSVSERLVKAGAQRVVRDAEGLAEAWIELIRDPDAVRAMGEAGAHVLRENRGATRRILELLCELLRDPSAGAREAALTPPATD